MKRRGSFRLQDCQQRRSMEMRLVCREIPTFLVTLVSDNEQSDHDDDDDGDDGDDDDGGQQCR